jgi:hypothetical protein
MSGWYIMRRGWMDGFKPEAFLWSIEQAAWEDHNQWFNGHRIAVQRGEFVTSLRTMAEAFGWTVKRVRGLMERLGKAGNWAHRPAYEGAQAPTVLSVVNYAKYQELPRVEGTAKGTAKGTRGAQRGHSEGTQQNLRKPQETPLEEDSPSDSSSSTLPDLPPSLSMQLPVVLPATDDVADAFAAYQAIRREFHPSAKPLTLSNVRRTKLAARIKEIGGTEEWGRVLACIRGSPFLRGDTAPNYRFAEIDWILEPKNFLKITEGNYDDRSGTDRARPLTRSTPLDAMRAARVAVGLG